MSTRLQIISHLCRVDLPDTPVAFNHVLTLAVGKALGKSAIDAENFAAANTRRYWADILELVQEDKRSGLIPFCDIVDRDALLLRNPSAGLIEGACHKLHRTGILLRARPTMLGAIDGLTDRAYEALGCLVTRLIGAGRAQLTPKGNEGGIDFLATMHFYSKCHVFSGFGKEVRIVGQSKKYTTKVQVDAVDQFIKTIENVRHRSDRVDGVIPAWFHASSGPIVGWMVAHSGFQRGAQNEAKKHGIVLSDSRDLAETVALSRRFHPTIPATQRGTCLAADLTALLNEFA